MSEEWIPYLLSAAAVLLAVINALYVRSRDTRGDWKKQIDDLRAEQTEIADQLAEINADLRVLKKQVELFWQTVERGMAKKFRDE